MKNQYLECGKVCNAHGVRGGIKVESWCDSPKVLAKQKHVFIHDMEHGYVEHKVLTASASGELVIMTLEGVDSREKAVELKNTVLYLLREDIPVKAGQMLLADMIGLPVIDANNGRIYGKIKDVQEAARGLLYIIETENGDVLFPSVPQFIKEISEENGMLITPIEGFFE